MRTEPFAPSDIVVRARLREVDDAAVDRLAESIRQIGLQTPITVRWINDADGEVEPVLVAGRHRLAACVKLGLETIQCSVLDGSDIDARLWEIAENLHRADLSVQERADHIAEWVRLSEEKAKAQLAPSAHSGGRPSKGINSAVRELGIDRTEAQRAVKIASIDPAAKTAAARLGVKSQAALLDVARTSADQQVSKVHELAERRSKPAPAIKDASESEEDWRRALFNVWNRGAQDWRERAMETIDVSPHVNTRFG